MAFQGGRRLGSQTPARPSASDAALLPLLDYFALDDGHGQQTWHMLLPLMPSGNLRTVAASISADPWIRTQTPDELDALFRPALHRLLKALHTMHAGHGLCHDDIKPENILATVPRYNHYRYHHHNHHRYPYHQPLLAVPPQEATEWFLADFNSVRHVHHPYHATGLWRRDNGQLPDCRANDVRRLLRTYAQFLRGCLRGHPDLRAAFDADFMARTRPWSRLYWEGIEATGHEYDDDSVSVAEVLMDLSGRYLPTAEGRAGRMMVDEAGRAERARVVKEELERTMWVDVNGAKKKGLTWLLGAPRGSGC